MKSLHLALAAFLFSHTLTTLRAAVPLPRSTPEEQGVSSAALLDLVTALDERAGGMHSLMILRRGRVLAGGWWAPYAPERRHVLYSLSKSFTSTAVGLAVAEGKLSVDDDVLRFFPDDAPAAPEANLKAMKVRDLLTMTAGHQDESPTAPGIMSPQKFLAQPVPHVPGSHFKYNTPATFMQSAIVQRVTGAPVLEYLQTRLFAPLEIETPVWDTNYQGINLGGYGLRVRTEDIAKFGQLYLQKGEWNGRRILPEAWVEQATSRQVPNGSDPASDWAQGYGYQFWRCRHGAYRGDGAFGQYCLVLPEQEAVVAITSGVKDMPGVLNILWEKLLPAFHPQPLPEDAAAQAALQEKLSRLAIPRPAGAGKSPLAAQISGRTYVFPQNDQLLESLTMQAPSGAVPLSLVLRQAGREWTYPCTHDAWAMSRGPFTAGTLANFPDEPIAASYAWEADDTILIRLCACETPYQLTLRLKFSGDTVTLGSELNVAFGPTQRPVLTGTAK